MELKQEYLNAAYPEGAKPNIGGNIRAAFANPLAQIALMGVVLTLIQVLALQGMLSSSFAYALGNTLIYAIVAIGFCFKNPATINKIIFGSGLAGDSGLYRPWLLCGLLSD